MLKQRVLFGSLLIVAILGLFALDGFLETIVVGDWAVAWLGRSTLPPGLAFLVLIVALMPVAAGELTTILKAKSIDCSATLISLCSLLTALTVYLMPADTKAINPPTS
ncbi:MAG: hypothetical protein R3236_05365, partial [Phycisphaeraceae bacterium]|nr:hypothetical protein [Phycisphaeraceae bacterium]